MAAPMQLQFAPFSSVLDGGFWHTLSQKKIDEFCLDDGVQEIHGFYSNSDIFGSSGHMNLDFTAFSSIPKTPNRSYSSKGSIHNTNTLDDFNNLDKKQLLEDQGKKLWDDIISNRALVDPSLLVRFHLITFADLKKYVFNYWFLFPAFVTEPIYHVTQPVKLHERISQTQINSFLTAYDEFRVNNVDGFFLLNVKDETVQISSISNYQTFMSENDAKPFLCFCDPCSLENHPGWPLRNFLTMAGKLWYKEDTEVEVLCFRDRASDGKRDVSNSVVFHLKIPSLANVDISPNCVGWEKNEKQKLLPRFVDLSATMDPVKLAETSIDLNLKLMRWRLLPDLNLDIVANTKCLILGAGTLGCNVARNLLGWGVRTITFVDNAKISFSNPVRQSLFVFEDCLNRGRHKAEAAADSLRRIFPGVKSEGIKLTIPMPGHIVSDSSVDKVKSDFEKLEKLIDNHDAIFLLMDTREARWLPTLIGAAKQKLVINAALGFDTFLVMRHGKKSSKPTPKDFDPRETIPGDQLGCYFCNDVVAPGDSTRDRTLDQQCTVSRPGMSMIVSAMAVELLVSLLQHPLQGEAPADTDARDEHLIKELSCSLGLVPHQIRGFMSRFNLVLPVSRVFQSCTACCDKVVNTYKTDGFDFLLKAFNDPNYLEELTGLRQLQLESEDIDVWDFSDDESVGDK